MVEAMLDSMMTTKCSRERLLLEEILKEIWHHQMTTTLTSNRFEYQVKSMKALQAIQKFIFTIWPEEPDTVFSNEKSTV